MRIIGSFSIKTCKNVYNSNKIFFIDRFQFWRQISITYKIISNNNYWNYIRPNIWYLKISEHKFTRVSKCNYLAKIILRKTDY